MARFEALITPVIDGNDLRETLDQIAQQWGGSLTWLDRRNASLDLVSAGLQLKFLLELRRGDDLLLLVTSREGMGAGAPPYPRAFGEAAGLDHRPHAQVAGDVPLGPRRPDPSSAPGANPLTDHNCLISSSH